MIVVVTEHAWGRLIVIVLEVGRNHGAVSRGVVMVQDVTNQKEAYATLLVVVEEETLVNADVTKDTKCLVVNQYHLHAIRNVQKDVANMENVYLIQVREREFVDAQTIGPENVVKFHQDVVLGAQDVVQTELVYFFKVDQRSFGDVNAMRD
jgi:hypothetical protein